MAEPATHTCRICAALWRCCSEPGCGGLLGTRHWHLKSRKAGQCCGDDTTALIPLAVALKARRRWWQRGYRCGRCERLVRAPFWRIPRNWKQYLHVLRCPRCRL